jgi:exonuclease III
MVFATEKEHAGVSILIKDQWADMITGTLNIIEDGRCISIKLQTPQNGNIIITRAWTDYLTQTKQSEPRTTWNTQSQT